MDINVKDASIDGFHKWKIQSNALVATQHYGEQKERDLFLL